MPVTGAVDIVAPDEEIPDHLLRLKSAEIDPPDEDEAAIVHTMRLEICSILRTQFGHNYTVVGEEETAFAVIRRIWRRNAIMAVVVRGRRDVPRGFDVAVVITKWHVADSLAESVSAYPRQIAPKGSSSF
jgi:hypothetical protein